MNFFSRYDENSKKKFSLKKKFPSNFYFNKFGNSKRNKKTTFIETNNAEIEVAINSLKQKLFNN